MLIRHRFDENKNYVRVQVQDNVPIPAQDLNEAYRIFYNLLNTIVEERLGDGFTIGGFKVSAAVSTDEQVCNFVLSSGTVYHKGRRYELKEQISYQEQLFYRPGTGNWGNDYENTWAVATDDDPPDSGYHRYDVVYLELYERTIGVETDASLALVDTAGAIETAKRKQLIVRIGIAIGTEVLTDDSPTEPSIPTDYTGSGGDPDSHWFIKLATIERTEDGGVISAGAISDKRSILSSLGTTSNALYLLENGILSENGKSWTPSLVEGSYDTIMFEDPVPSTDFLVIGQTAHTAALPPKDLQGLGAGSYYLLVNEGLNYTWSVDNYADRELHPDKYKDYYCLCWVRVVSAQHAAEFKDMRKLYIRDQGFIRTDLEEDFLWADEGETLAKVSWEINNGEAQEDGKLSDKTITSSGAQFLSKGVKAGDTFEIVRVYDSSDAIYGLTPWYSYWETQMNLAGITVGNSLCKFTVSSVTDENTLVLSTAPADANSYFHTTGDRYFIYRVTDPELSQELDRSAGSVDYYRPHSILENLKRIRSVLGRLAGSGRKWWELSTETLSVGDADTLDGHDSALYAVAGAIPYADITGKLDDSWIPTNINADTVDNCHAHHVTSLGLGVVMFGKLTTLTASGSLTCYCHTAVPPIAPGCIGSASTYVENFICHKIKDAAGGAADSIQASTTATEGMLYPLGTGAKFPNTVLNTGSGNSLDADTVDGVNALNTTGIGSAGQLVTMDAAGYSRIGTFPPMVHNLYRSLLPSASNTDENNYTLVDSYAFINVGHLILSLPQKNLNHFYAGVYIKCTAPATGWNMRLRVTKADGSAFVTGTDTTGTNTSYEWAVAYVDIGVVTAVNGAPLCIICEIKRSGTGGSCEVDATYNSIGFLLFCATEDISSLLVGI